MAKGVYVKRIYLSLAVMLAITIGAYSLVITGNAMQPEAAQAHQSCEDYWQHSGHVENARWYHCHNWESYYTGDEVTRARVHICGDTGALHGIYVEHIHRWMAGDRWNSYAHSHDGGGEGC